MSAIEGKHNFCEDKDMEQIRIGTPCRHCLRLITPGIDRRILFTYDRFAGVESLPLPGPTENAGFPDELRASPHTLEGYARGRHLVAREYVTDGKMERVVEQFFASSDGDYIHVNSTTAGCYTFRIERWDRAICQPGRHYFRLPRDRARDEDTGHPRFDRGHAHDFRSSVRNPKVTKAGARGIIQKTLRAVEGENNQFVLFP